MTKRRIVGPLMRPVVIASLPDAPRDIPRVREPAEYKVAVVREHEHYMGNLLRRVEGSDSPTLAKIKHNRKVLAGITRLFDAIGRAAVRTGAVKVKV